MLWMLLLVIPDIPDGLEVDGALLLMAPVDGPVLPFLTPFAGEEFVLKDEPESMRELCKAVPKVGDLTP